MTDRIKALGLQASALALEEYRTRMKTEFAGDVIYSDIYDRKFAELIVKECIKLCDQVDLVGADDCIDKIKDYFEVDQ